MKLRQIALSGLFVTALAVSGAAYAHAEDSPGKDGSEASSHHQDCHAAQLSEAKRQVLHEAMKTAFEKNRDLFDQMHKLHEDLRGILKADNFDRQAFTTISAQIAEIDDRIQAIRTEAFASIATQFTPEEREMLLRLHGRHHRHGDDGGWS
jgi:Spy/CpxP family protein refolding chaperone